MIKNKNRFRFLVKLVCLFKEYKCYQFNHRFPATLKATKVAYFDLKDFHNHKFYFYCLIKFFKIEGYTVCIKPGFRNFYLIQKEAGRIFKEGLVFFGNPKTHNQLSFNDANLSVNYFSLEAANSSKSYKIPMTMHPQMYHLGLHELPAKKEERNKAIFMAGNFNEKYYSWIEDGPFNVVARHQLRSVIFSSSYNLRIKTEAKLKGVLKEGVSKKCLLIDLEEFFVPQNELLNTLDSFTFFLACPGILMPLSHNLIEAMSRGTIPIIEKSYAALMAPGLVHLNNAIIFDGKDDLLLKIEQAFDLQSDTLMKISMNVKHYYDTFLTPAAVVSVIEQRYNSHTFYLLGGSRSIDKIKG
ncbi:hypothetical protein DSM04_107105 [Leeuwenhoekiella aestuarii]|uniref:Glycosyl transferase family 1 n=1 Tax=Leeuwenhoekiella aestuarii TaxID=2249426 RepID=A0A4Q0NPR3_9FLAO|nr:hypothetical protein DSM04_107105 [Leeuwenhoekiella aestuarii]